MELIQNHFIIHFKSKIKKILINNHLIKKGNFVYFMIFNVRNVKQNIENSNVKIVEIILDMGIAGYVNTFQYIFHKYQFISFSFQYIVSLGYLYIHTDILMHSLPTPLGYFGSHLQISKTFWAHFHIASLLE